PSFPASCRMKWVHGSTVTLGLFLTPAPAPAPRWPRAARGFVNQCDHAPDVQPPLMVWAGTASRPSAAPDSYNPLTDSGDGAGVSHIPGGRSSPSLPSSPYNPIRCHIEHRHTQHIVLDGRVRAGAVLRFTDVPQLCRQQQRPVRVGIDGTTVVDYRLGQA